MRTDALKPILKKLQGLDEKQQQAILDNFSPADQEQILKALKAAVPKEPVPEKEKPAAKAAPKKNAHLDLSGFDYNNLNGEALKAYFQLAGRYDQVAPKLLLNQQYTFELYKAYGEFEYELDKQTGKPFKVLTGIKLRSPLPIHTTQIAAKDAMLLNAQIDNSGPLDMNAKFYLLKK